MEPFSLTVGILALINAIIATYKFSKTAAGAPKELAALIVEIEAVETVVTNVQHIRSLREVRNHDVPAPPDQEAFNQLTIHLISVQEKLQEVKAWIEGKLTKRIDSVDSEDDASTKVKRLSTAKRLSKIQRMIKELGRLRDSIYEASQLLNTCTVQVLSNNMQDVVALVRTMPQDLNASIQSNRQLIQSDMSLFLERAITTLCQQMHATTSEWAENSTQHRRQSPLYQHRRTAGVEQHQYSPSTSWRSRQHRPRTPVLSCSDEESESSRNARPSHASQTLSCRARFNNLRKVAEQLDQASSRMEADFELSSSWFPETYTQKTRVPKFLCARYQVLAPQTGEQLLEWHIWWSDSPRRWRMIRVTTAAKQQHKNFADEALTMQKWYSQYLWVSPTQLALPCSTSQLMAYISCEGALADDVTNLTLRADQTTKLVELCEDENKPYEPEDACYKSTYRSAEYLLDAQSLGCRIILEREVIIQDIVSGFTARVLIDGRECIEKKLPLAPVHLNPFLYEMKALYLLRHCPGIIRFVGVEVDNAGKKLQGFIRGCEDSDLSGLLRELYKRRQHIPWSLKEKWAGQLLTGVLSAHKSGLVIGTLDVNEIGVDEKQDAKLLHVGHGRCDERSGCLAPELRLRVNHTDATQRLSDVHMNARQDIFALGLVLWLIAQTDIPYTFITDSRTHGRKPWWKRLFCHKAHCTRGESVAEASWCTKDHTDPVDLPPCDNSTPLYFQHLIARCRASVPAQRATAQELMAIYKEHRGYSNDQWFP